MALLRPSNDFEKIPRRAGEGEEKHHGIGGSRGWRCILTLESVSRGGVELCQSLAT